MAGSSRDGNVEVGRAVCVFLWTSLAPGLQQNFRMLQWVSSRSRVGVGDQDGALVPQARLFSRSILEIENHLARDAVFAKMEGRLRSPEQDILLFTLIHFLKYVLSL